MKKTLLALAMIASFGANAQFANSGSQSGSTSGADSASVSGVQATNSGNVNTNAIGNQNSSQSQSGSTSGASSGSQSGAYGNAVEINSYGPETQTLTQEVNYTGGTRSYVEQSGTTTNRIEYSGTQTVKNVPGIAMSGPASGPCTGVSGGIGLAGPGWGVGLNGSSVMDDCRLRENTRVIGMGMQALDGTAYPQEKAETMVMFMDSMRALAAYNREIAEKATKEAKK